MHKKIIGIMGAMPEEIDGVAALLADKTVLNIAGRNYYSGAINNIKTVVAVSGWGKVAAAATVSALIHKFNIDELVFTGVAGAINPALKIGDIVIGRRLVQHDMDARPFIPQYEIPLLKKTFFEGGPERISIAKTAAEILLADKNLYALISAEDLLSFNIVSPKVYIGDIASGDQFISDAGKREELLKNLPGILCVEMEGAAVAQVCYESGIPFTIARTISDAANEQSHIDFTAFIRKVASGYSVGLVKNIFSQS